MQKGLEVQQFYFSLYIISVLQILQVHKYTLPIMENYKSLKQIQSLKNKWKKKMYLPNPSTMSRVRRDKFLSGVLLVRIQNFPSPRPVAIPKLMSLVFPIIYLKLDGE